MKMEELWKMNFFLRFLCRNSELNPGLDYFFSIIYIGIRYVCVVHNNSGALMRCEQFEKFSILMNIQRREEN